MIQPFVDAAASVPLVVWALVVLLGLALGFGALLITHTFDEDARRVPKPAPRSGGRPHPARGRSPRPFRRDPFHRYHAQLRRELRRAERAVHEHVRGGHLR